MLLNIPMHLYTKLAVFMGAQRDFCTYVRTTMLRVNLTLGLLLVAGQFECYLRRNRVTLSVCITTTNKASANLKDSIR